MEPIVKIIVCIVAMLIAVYVGGTFAGNAITQYKKGEDATCGFSIMFASVFIAWIFKIVWIMIQEKKYECSNN